MKTPNTYFLIGGSILITLTAFTFRLINADYFAPSENCDEIVRYMSGCSLSCTENGPVGRYSCEKTIDTDEQTLTTCTRQPYNPAITGRDNGAYETTSTLGGCTLTCGGGYAVCRGDAPERGGYIPPSVLEPEHPSGPAQGDTQTGTCQGSIPANASGTSASTYLQTYTSDFRVPADNLERTYSASPGTCSFSCETNYIWTGGSCRLPPSLLDNPNGALVLPGTVGVEVIGNDIYIRDGNGYGYIIQDRNLGATAVYAGTDAVSNYGNYYQRGNNYAFPNTDTPSTSSTAVSTAGKGPGNRYSSSTWITTSPRSSSFTATSCDIGNNLWGGRCDGFNTIGTGTFADRQGPCPSGYHVPSNSEWYGLVCTWIKYRNPSASCPSQASNTNFVWAGSATLANFKSDLKLPYAGYRSFSTADLTIQGSRGYYWSSSPSLPNSAHYLYFYSSVLPQQSDTRSSGFSVRCFKNE
ncbi:hypothetical protein AGMMS50249_0190 [candidate division SR1 bacterium]|nr:hypothetical protein AGMMS50249_0190 [candidate division SR1 bacterium]